MYKYGVKVYYNEKKSVDFRYRAEVVSVKYCNQDIEFVPYVTRAR
jgi:hypothetical protein